MTTAALLFVFFLIIYLQPRYVSHGHCLNSYLGIAVQGGNDASMVVVMLFEHNNYCIMSIIKFCAMCSKQFCVGVFGHKHCN